MRMLVCTELRAGDHTHWCPPLRPSRAPRPCSASQTRSGPKRCEQQTLNKLRQHERTHSSLTTHTCRSASGPECLGRTPRPSCPSDSPASSGGETTTRYRADTARSTCCIKTSPAPYLLHITVAPIEDGDSQFECRRNHGSRFT